jgi:hypothetical protein
MASATNMPTCAHCAEVLSGFLIQHDETACPLSAAAYCCHCAVHGHFSSKCPDRPPVHAVEPVPIGLASAVAAPATPTPANIIEVVETNTSLRSFLSVRGITPSAKIKENRKKIDHMGAIHGKKIIYIQP